MTSSLDILHALGGYQEQRKLGDPAPPLAVRSVRLAVIDPAYDAQLTWPAAAPNPLVRFEGEDDLTLEDFAYLNGYVPSAGDRVLMVQIGTTWVIIGKVDHTLDQQGFWSDATGSGVELGAGSYFDGDEGLVLAGDLTRRGHLIVDNKKTIISQALTAANTSGQGVNYVNIGPSTTFTKLYGVETNLEIWGKISAYFTAGTVPTPARLGMRVNGVDYSLDQTHFQVLNQHFPLSGWQKIAGLAAGTYTIQPRMRAVSGTTIPTMAVDANDFISYRIEEVEA
jgi:hypothetical protein